MLFESPKLNETQLDAIKEMGNIGAGHAATALSQLIEKKIEKEKRCSDAKRHTQCPQEG